MEAYEDELNQKYDYYHEEEMGSYSREDPNSTENAGYDMGYADNHARYPDETTNDMDYNDETMEMGDEYADTSSSHDGTVYEKEEEGGDWNCDTGDCGSDVEEPKQLPIEEECGPNDDFGGEEEKPEPSETNGDSGEYTQPPTLKEGEEDTADENDDDGDSSVQEIIEDDEQENLKDKGEESSADVNDSSGQENKKGGRKWKKKNKGKKNKAKGDDDSSENKGDDDSSEKKNKKGGKKWKSKSDNE